MAHNFHDTHVYHLREDVWDSIKNTFDSMHIAIFKTTYWDFIMWMIFYDQTYTVLAMSPHSLKKVNWLSSKGAYYFVYPVLIRIMYPVSSLSIQIRKDEHYNFVRIHILHACMYYPIVSFSDHHCSYIPNFNLPCLKQKKKKTLNIYQ